MSASGSKKGIKRATHAYLKNVVTSYDKGCDLPLGSASFEAGCSVFEELIREYLVRATRAELRLHERKWRAVAPAFSWGVAARCVPGGVSPACLFRRRSPWRDSMWGLIVQLRVAAAAGFLRAQCPRGVC